MTLPDLPINYILVEIAETKDALKGKGRVFKGSDRKNDKEEIEEFKNAESALRNYEDLVIQV